MLYQRIALVFLWTLFCISFATATPLVEEKTPFHIDKLQVDQEHNEVDLYGVFTNQNWKKILQDDTAKIQVNVVHKGAVFNTITITKPIQISDATFLIQLQLPLKDAILRSEPRTFQLIWSTSTHQYKAQKEVVLGSVLHTFDLRSYTQIDTMYTLGIALVFVSCILGFLMLLTPVYNAFIFKKKYITKYGKVQQNEEEQQQDFFTFMTIKDQDQIVKRGDKMMLLSSWKIVNTLSGYKPAEAYADFFTEKLEGTFFHPKSKRLKKVNTVWYGVIGMAMGWIMYLFFVSDIMAIVAPMFIENNVLEVVFQGLPIRVADTFLGVSIGFFCGLGLAIAEQAQNKTKALWKIIGKACLRTILITLAFVGQSILITELATDFYIAGLITWCCISMGFAIIIAFQFRMRYEIIVGLSTTIVGYGIYHLLAAYAIQLLDNDICVFFTLMAVFISICFMIPFENNKVKPIIEEEEEEEEIVIVPGVKVKQEEQVALKTDIATTVDVLHNTIE